MSPNPSGYGEQIPQDPHDLQSSYSYQAEPKLKELLVVDSCIPDSEKNGVDKVKKEHPEHPPHESGCGADGKEEYLCPPIHAGCATYVTSCDLERRFGEVSIEFGIVNTTLCVLPP